MSTIEYHPRTAWGNKADIIAIAERIESLKDKNGHITRERVIEDARDPGSPLHKSFTWDDTKAAEKWRLFQARKLINCYYIKIVETGQKTIVIKPANVHVHSPEFPSRFISAPAAMSEEESRIQVLEDCSKLLVTIQDRLASLKGISPAVMALFDQIKRLLDKEKARKPKVPKR